MTNVSKSEVSEFLLILYQKGLKYSAINTTRRMLPMILTLCDKRGFGKDVIIAGVLKRIFRNDPGMPRCMVKYEPDLVLNYFKLLPSCKCITLKWLTLKTATILALLSGHRCQTINSLTPDHMYIDIRRVNFYISKVIKNTAKSFHSQAINLQ